MFEQKDTAAENDGLNISFWKIIEVYIRKWRELDTAQLMLPAIRQREANRQSQIAHNLPLYQSK